MLQTLVAIARADENTRTSRYRLGTRILGLGSAGLVTDPVVQNANMFLHRLAETTGHTLLLSTLVGARVVYVARVPGRLGHHFEFEPEWHSPRTRWRTANC